MLHCASMVRASFTGGRFSKSSMETKAKLGPWGEALAAAFLRKRGYHIVATNYRSRYGEIDIIAENAEYLVFAEVKLRKTAHFGAAREFVDSAAAATGEILFDLYAETGLSRLPMTAKAAVFGAIASDTGCFKYANVTPSTHLRAAALLTAGVDGARVNQLLFDTKEMSQIRAEGLAQSRLRLFDGGRVSAIVIENTDYTDGLVMADFETAVDIARSVRGVQIAIVIKGAPKAGVYRVSLRGNEGTPVSGIAAAFGGGGHLLAAGCTVEAESGDAALQMLLDEVEKEK